MERCFLNHTNHPSDRWGKEQMRAASSYGVVEDLPFPAVLPGWTTEQVDALAAAYAARILDREPAAVLCQGESCYVFSLVTRLKAAGLPVLAACSERRVREREDEAGNIIRESQFCFVQFRGY